MTQDLVQQVIAVFDELYRLRSPIEKVDTVERYPAAADELSMEDNNTSAFNCRGIRGSDQWSPHAYGRAIDLNPLFNPSITGNGIFEPKNAAPYLDRGRTDPHSCMAEIRPYMPLRIVVGGGVVTGSLPSITSTSSSPDRRTQPHDVPVPLAQG